MALDNTKLLARLLESANSLGALVDLEVYLQSILSAVIEVTESKSAALMEYDEAAQEFCFKYMPWFQRDLLLNVKVPLNGSAAGWIFSNAQPLLINDIKNDTRQHLRIGTPQLFDARSLLGVPLIHCNKAVGVFKVFNKETPYAQQDVSALQAFAALAASAIQDTALEKRIVSSQKEARELERLKTDFIAITSHELRTPLGLILGHSTFLREMVSKEHLDQVDTIIRSASKLKEIIESLSDMDNQQTGSATLRERQISVARIIEDVALSFREMAEQKGVLLSVEKDPDDDLRIEGDSGKLSIALSNLVKNAIAFTNEGGHVFIVGEVEGRFIKVSVVDDGLGIPVKDQPHLFERFYQVESHLTRRHGGMGLGLSVAKAMVEMHNGQIWLESKEGVGSKFTFILPAEGKQGETNPSPFI
jgi:signal transduction histidine kinase